MAQQGIFSIAPDAQTSANNPQASTQVNGGKAVNSSPFTAVADSGSTDSPFAAVARDTPAQQAKERNEIPQRRPEGQMSALGGGSSSEAKSHFQPAIASEEKELKVAQDNAGGAFQMNGFSEQGGRQVMEAAPVAPSPEPSPFVPVQNTQPNYEAAKAGLEPQQDFAAVQPQYAPTPAQGVQPVSAPQPVATQTPAQSSPMGSSAGVPASSFQQLELRAIFGVDHALDVDGILQRARTLPGIRNVALVGPQESAALSNFRLAMQSMGFGDADEMKLNAGGGSVDFLSEGDTTVAVLYEGSYAPGVKETLIIVAREIGKLI